MKISIATLSGVLAVAMFSSASPLPARINPPVEETTRVIVILRDQHAEIPSLRGAHAKRAAALRAAQEPLISPLLQKRARQVRSFELINAFSTDLTRAEMAQLAGHPLVQAVVPDAVIQAPQRRAPAQRPRASGAASPAIVAPIDNGPLCDTLEPEALQLTNTAFLDPSVPQAQTVLDGNGAPVTGKGVKVAYVADGLDPTIAGFVRPDGSSVFIDYQDFSGDPAGSITNGGEAFGDASSIAAQDLPNGQPLLFDISTYAFASYPGACNIRIRGVAPGVSLVGIKIFSTFDNSAYLTTVVQAIEYAVVHDDVDVINESIVEFPYPDNTNDPISLANAAAVRAGVTVVVASGDAGPGGIGSPASDPSVITAGASTQYRFYAQTGDSLTGDYYLDNNIAAFSSSGFGDRKPRTIDVVAPGDWSWALCSTNSALYAACTDSFGDPSPIESFSGTSEAAPLTAGEAALIIQAYRSAHHGATPSPALVKQIIMSTATDLGAPSDEQGAGLINTLKAVQVALSIQDGSGRPKPRGDGILLTPSFAEVVAAAREPQTQLFEVTNTSATVQHLTPNLQTLAAPFAGESIHLQMDDSDNSFLTQTITVPAGADHLDAAIAFQTTYGQTSHFVFLFLIDPEGREAINSNEQGPDNGYAHVDIVHPEAGDWLAVVATYYQDGPFSYTGPVQLTWSAESYINLGSVFPSHLDLPPGAAGLFAARFNMPSQAGDTAAAIRFAGAGDVAEIPISLRTLVSVDRSGGSFTGTLTGGNGRGGSGTQSAYVFDVPQDVNDLSLSLEVSDPGYLLQGLLMDPSGMPLSVEGNIDAAGAQVGGLQLFRDHPQAGRWSFILLQNYYSSGNQTSLPFTAQIKFNSAQAKSGLPNDRHVKLSASGAPVTVALTVTNTGVETQGYFADARSTQMVRQSISVLPCDGVTTTTPVYCGSAYLPTQTTSVQFSAQSTIPIVMQAFNQQGYLIGFTSTPDLWAFPAGHGKLVASIDAAEVAYGPWAMLASAAGRSGSSGAPTAPVDAEASATMQAFDSSIAADSGDFWMDLTLGTNTYNPLMLAPGGTGTIHLTITPDSTQVGKVVSGNVYLDTFNFNVFTGDEVARFPYTYTVGK